MSSVDPRWAPPVGPPAGWSPTQAPPPQPPPTRPRRPAYVYVVAAAVVLALVVALLLPLGVAAVWREFAPAVQPQAAGQAGPVVDGSRGIGDPYYPDAGNGGYDVSRYQVSVSWDPRTETLSGTTTISARSLQGLHSFFLDLRLNVTEVAVDGQDAGLAKDGDANWRVTPATPVPAGDDFTVVVAYDGRPGDIAGVDGERPWNRSGEEWVVSGEPESAAWWFPSTTTPPTRP